MSDINRESAIERFCELGTSLERQNKTVITMVDAKYIFIKILESLPSVDRPIGEWIKYTNFNGELKTYECSNCKYPQGHKTPYCCECGAKMEEAE